MAKKKKRKSKKHKAPKTVAQATAAVHRAKAELSKAKHRAKEAHRNSLVSSFKRAKRKIDWGF